MFCACERDDVDVMSKDWDDDTYAGCIVQRLDDVIQSQI